MVNNKSRCSKKNGEPCRIHNPIRTHNVNSPAETMVNQIVSSAVPRDLNEDYRKYFEATDKKHMGNKNEPGSKFLDTNIQTVEDVLKLAIQQRGSLNGDDKTKFLSLGSELNAFQEGNRYLYVSTPGTVGVIHSSELNDDTLLTVERTKPGVPCSLVTVVKEQQRTDYAVVIMSKDEERNKDILITTFPGLVTKSLKDPEIEKLEGKTLTIADVKKILGNSFWLNTKLEN